MTKMTGLQRKTTRPRAVGRPAPQLRGPFSSPPRSMGSSKTPAWAWRRDPRPQKPPRRAHARLTGGSAESQGTSVLSGPAPATEPRTKTASSAFLLSKHHSSARKEADISFSACYVTLLSARRWNGVTRRNAVQPNPNRVTYSWCNCTVIFFLFSS